MIKVIDGVMGCGKTSWAINYINRHPRKHFLYVSPLKSEDERIQKYTHDFYVPPDIEGVPKLPRLKHQLRKKRNVASTHALFRLFDEECLDLVRRGGYTLILDEVIEVLNPIDVKKQDVDVLTNSNAAIVDENYRMVWTDVYANLSEVHGYGWLENLIKLNRVINVDGMLMWEFPSEMFIEFKDVFILTYMFEGNVMSNYLHANNIEYVTVSIKDGELTDYYKPDTSVYTSLINIYDGKLNSNIYSTNTSFSLNWYKRQEDGIYLDRMRNNLYNYFHHITQAKSSDTMWTVFKDFRDRLKGKGYTKGFVSAGCRATNLYRNKSVLAYCINRFYQPMLVKYFAHLNHPVNEDLYAISDLVQWMWRSKIRDGKEICIYIPSPRMRALLQKWLQNEI